MAEVYLDIKGKIEKVQKDIKNVQTEMGKLQTKSEQVTKNMQGGFENVTRVAQKFASTLGIAVSAAAFINYIRKMGGELVTFQKTLTNVYTLLSNTEKLKYREFLKEGSLDLMSKYGFAVEDVNKALFDTISAGIKAGDSIKFLDQAAKLAIGGVTSLSNAVYGMNAILNAYNLSMDEAEKVSAAFFTAQKYGVTTVEQLVTVVGEVAPVAKAAGIGYQEILAALALLTKQGINTDMAATALRATILGLTASTQESKKKFESLGIETGLVALRQNGLGKTLFQVAKAAEENADVLTELIPNVRALTGVAALGTEALILYESILKDINIDYGEGSSLMGAYEEQASTTEQTFKRFGATIKRTWIESKNLGGIVGGLTKAIAWMTKNMEANIEQQKNMTIGNTKEWEAFYNSWDKFREIVGETTEEVTGQTDAADELNETIIKTAGAIEAVKEKITELTKKIPTLSEKELPAANRELAKFNEELKRLLSLGIPMELKLFKTEDIDIEDFIAESGKIFDEVNKEWYEQSEELTKILSDKRKRELENEFEDIQDAEAAKQEIIAKTFETIGILWDSIAEIRTRNMNRELAEVEGNEAAQEAIRRKYMRREKTFAIGRALISGAEAIMNIASKWAWNPPVQAALSALQAITTAAQVAVIASQKFATGVLDLQGRGTGTSDSIPAMLSRGESVMTARETKEYYPYLKAMKEGKFPKLQMELLNDFSKLQGITNNNLNYDNSKEIRELREIRKALTNDYSETIEGKYKIIRRGGITTKISLN